MRQVVTGVDHQVGLPPGQLAQPRLLAALPRRMWKSLRCSTRSGADPGVSTGIVVSRTTNALRSINERVGDPRDQ